MAKKMMITTFMLGVVLLSVMVFPKMVSYGVARTLQYVHIGFSFILIGVIFYLISKIEKKNAEQKTLENVFEAKKKDIYRLRQALHESSLTLKSILAEDGQGYLTIGVDGKVSLTYSRSCIALFEVEPGNMFFFDVLKLAEEERDQFNQWLDMLFEEPISFEEAAPLGPDEFINSRGAKIALSYSAIRNDSGEILNVLVTAEDVTDFEQLSRKALEKAEESEVIARLIKQKETFVFFNQEFNEGIKSYKEILAKGKVDSEVIKSFLRYLHGVNGGFLQIGLNSFGLEIHDREDAWSQLLIDNNLVELQEQLESDIEFLQEGWVKFVSKYSRIVGYSLEETQRIIEFKLSEAIELYTNLSIISIPAKINETFRIKLTKSIGKYFEQYQDLVKEIAKNLDKDIYPLEIQGGNINVMPEAYKDLFVSMGHLFRNSIDHGIETPLRRSELNKDPTGKIILKFSKYKNNIQDILSIEVIDDGKGIDASSLRKSLIRKGDESVKDMKDEEVIQKIFDDGISTKSEKLDLLSGRGVGVSAVKASVEQMKGRIWVESEVNKGCHFHIHVPFIELNFKNIDLHLN